MHAVGIFRSDALPTHFESEKPPRHVFLNLSSQFYLVETFPEVFVARIVNYHCQNWCGNVSIYCKIVKTVSNALILRKTSSSCNQIEFFHSRLKGQQQQNIKILPKSSKLLINSNNLSVMSCKRGWLRNCQKELPRPKYRHGRLRLSVSKIAAVSYCCTGTFLICRVRGSCLSAK